MTRKIGLIPGTGKQSQGLALRLSKAGYNVMVGSRTKEKAERVAGELKEKLHKDNFIGGTYEEVARNSNLIFLVVPYGSLIETIEKIKPNLKPGTIIVDVIVPLVFESGYANCLNEIPCGSVSEYIKSLVSDDIIVVGAFKTISASILNRIEKPLKVDLFMTSDNIEAKKELKEIFLKIDGLRVLDAGLLKFSKTAEQMTAFVININRLNKLHHASFKLVSSK
ncbi:MAG TPA: NADPH-dependent F420 reductase [candidate division Zixibacteria bacterium]|nr:NADPH-dependent F420 reductase [candidate division Zixibacteria bacterium]